MRPSECDKLNQRFASAVALRRQQHFKGLKEGAKTETSHGIYLDLETPGQKKSLGLVAENKMASIAV